MQYQQLWGGHVYESGLASWWDSLKNLRILIFKENNKQKNTGPSTLILKTVWTSGFFWWTNAKFGSICSKRLQKMVWSTIAWYRTQGNSLFGDEWAGGRKSMYGRVLMFFTKWRRKQYMDRPSLWLQSPCESEGIGFCGSLSQAAAVSRRSMYHLIERGFSTLQDTICRWLPWYL